MSVWKFLLRLSIGLLLVWYLLCKHELDVQVVLARIKELPTLVLIGALGINLMGQSLCALRWSTLSTISGYPARLRDVLRIYFSGMFFNMCLPTSIGGDVFRVVGLGRKTGSKTAAFASVFMDRNIGLAALLSIGFAGSAIAGTMIRATVFNRLLKFPIWPIFAVLIVGYTLANVALFNERFYRFVSRLLVRARLKFVQRRLQPLHDALGNYHLSWTQYVSPVGLSCIYQASEIALIWMLADGLGVHLSGWVFCSMVAFQAVASLLPITFNGVGVREAIFTAVIVGQLGESFKDEALALALIYFFGVVLLSSLAGGIVYLIGGVPRPSRLEVAETVGGE